MKTRIPLASGVSALAATLSATTSKRIWKRVFPTSMSMEWQCLRRWPSSLPAQGQFNESPMQYEADRGNDIAGEPSLTEMTQRAVERLKQWVLLIDR